MKLNDSTLIIIIGNSVHTNHKLHIWFENYQILMIDELIEGHLTLVILLLFKMLIGRVA